MIQIDLCHECPQCGNGSLANDDVYKYFGLKYIHTEYKCLMMKNECGFTTTGTKNLYFVYDDSLMKTKKREARLNSLFVNQSV
jgi:hypothetical protein